MADKKQKWCKIIETEECDILVIWENKDGKDFIKITFPFDGMIAETDFELPSGKDPQECFNSIKDETHIKFVKKLVKTLGKI